MSKRSGWIRSIPFALYIGVMAVDPLLEPFLPAGFDGRWLYGLRVGLVVLALAVLWRHFSELTSSSTVPWQGWVEGLAVGILVLVIWVNLDFSPLALAPGEGFDPRTGPGLDLPLVAVRLAGAALVVPVMEELFWRSFILRWIQHPSFMNVAPGAVGLRALILSSALFATEHRLWFAGLLAGLAYGWIYKRWGNLWVPILAHAVTNALLGAYVLATNSWALW
jgi:CAAX prenyl protease-like protein